MSLTLALLDTTAQLAAVPADAQLLAGGCAASGALDCINTKSGEALLSVERVSTVVAAAFVVVTAFRTKLAITPVIVAGLAAAVFLWIVYNTNVLKDATDAELNSLRAPLSTSQAWTPPAPPSSSGGLSASTSPTAVPAVAWPRAGSTAGVGAAGRLELSAGGGGVGRG